MESFLTVLNEEINTLECSNPLENILEYKGSHHISRKKSTVTIEYFDSEHPESKHVTPVQESEEVI